MKTRKGLYEAKISTLTVTKLRRRSKEELLILHKLKISKVGHATELWPRVMAPKKTHKPDLLFPKQLHFLRICRERLCYGRDSKFPGNSACRLVTFIKVKVINIAHGLNTQR